MKCPSCKNDNRDNKFCTKCGAMLSSTAKPVSSNRRSKSNIIFGSPKILGTIAVMVIGLVTLFIFLQINKSNDSSPAEISDESPIVNLTIPPTTVSTPVPSLKKVFDDVKIVGNLIEEVGDSVGDESFWGFYAFNDEFNKDFDADYPVSAISFGQFEIASESNYLANPEGWFALKELIKANVFVESDFGSGFSRYPKQSIDCDVDATCILTLEGYEDYVTKKYSKKETLKFRFNVPDSVSSKSEGHYVYYENMDIVNTYIEPTTCAKAYKKMTEVLKGSGEETRYFIRQLTSPKYKIC
jgi:hypothetical protein